MSKIRIMSRKETRHPITPTIVISKPDADQSSLAAWRDAKTAAP
jgi:hypothetical protein